MPLPDAVSTVTIGGRVLHPITGVPLSGTVTIEVPALSVSDGSLMGAGARTYSFTAGVFDSAPVLPASDSPNVTPSGWTARVTIRTDSDWNPVFQAPLPAAQPSTTLSTLYAQQVTTPPTVALYVPLSTVGAVGGPAGPLGSDGTIPAGQIPASVGAVQPWQVAEARAGLSNPAVLTPYSGNDPNNGITLASGTYQNYHFICTELIIPNDNTKLINCQITCSNANFGVRLDANTGQEVGRYLEHCQITAAGVGLSGAGFTARLVEVVDNGDDSVRLGRSHAEPTVLDHCRFHSFQPAAGAHADGVQILTPPAANIIIDGCSITMDTAVGYSMPPSTGYTAALFVDTADVPVDVGDPEPTRRGSILVTGTKLSSPNGNYSVVIDGPYVDIRDSTLLPGSTAVESIQAGVVVTGAGNIDGTGLPIVDTDIHGDLRDRYLVVDDPRQAGGGSSLVVRSAYITSGTVTLPNTSGAWQVVSQVTTGAFELDVPAAIGDWVEIDYNAMMRLNNQTSYLDVGVVVGASIVRFLTTGSATGGAEGDPATYPQPPVFLGHAGVRGFTVTSGDLDAGSVRFCMVVKATGGNLLFAESAYPFYWCAKNFGPHS